MKNSTTRTLSTLLLLLMVVAQITSALPLSGYQDLQTVDPSEVKDKYLGDHNDLQTADPLEVEDNYLGDHNDLQTVDPSEVEDNYLGDHQDLQTVYPSEVEDNYLGYHQDLQTVDPADIEVQIPIRLNELWLVDPTLAESIYNIIVDLTFDQTYFSENVEEEVGDRIVHYDNTEQAEAKEENKEAAEHSRKKRQTSVSGNVNVERTRGGRRLLGSLNLDHTWRNRHTLSGNLGVDYSRFTGFPSQRSYTGGLRYTYKPNSRTSFHIGANRNWGSRGRSNSFGVGFSRSFGR